MNVGHPESKNIVGFPTLLLYGREIVIVKTRIHVGDISANVWCCGCHYFAPPAFFEPIRRVRRGTDEEKARFKPDFAPSFETPGSYVWRARLGAAACQAQRLR